MAYETLLVEARDRVVLITMNRPAALNALNAQLKRELAQAIAAADADPAVAAIVLTGSEKAFAAGADVKEMAGKDFM
ncbi:MAG: enoyl-CoA hydratase-related protein, partial [bacterium]